PTLPALNYGNIHFTFTARSPGGGNYRTCNDNRPDEEKSDWNKRNHLWPDNDPGDIRIDMCELFSRGARPGIGPCIQNTRFYGFHSFYYSHCDPQKQKRKAGISFPNSIDQYSHFHHSGGNLY